MAQSIPGYTPPPNPGTIYYPPPPSPTLPPWVPPIQNVNPGRGSINSTAGGPQTASVSPQGTPLPITYGRDIIGPIISLVKVAGNNLYLRCVWCLGEVDAIESITCNGDPVPSGTKITNYVGKATQGIDPTLASVIPGYADNCVIQLAGRSVGVCYSVIVVPANSGTGFPQFTAQIRGMKVRDPRGFAFVSGIDGDFNTVTVKRPKISYEGTGHTYVRATGNRGTAATAGVDDSKGYVCGSLQINSLGVTQKICEAGGGKFTCYVDTNNYLHVVGKNSSGTTVLEIIATHAFKQGVSSSFAASWDISPGAGSVSLAIDGLSGVTVVTATVGNTINFGATGLSIGGEYAGTSNQLDGVLAGLSLVTGTYVNLSTSTGLRTVLDSANNVLLNNTGLITAPIGYPAGSFAFVNTPAVQSDPGTSWSITTPVSKDRYCAPGLNGGLYVYSSDTTAFPVTLTQPTTIGVGSEIQIYCHATFPSSSGGLNINSSITGLLFNLSSAQVDDLITYTPAVGETLTITPDSSSTTCSVVLQQFYITPIACNFYTQFLAFATSGEWTVTSGAPTQFSAVAGGVQFSATESIQLTTSKFYPGEVVSCLVQVGGTFTGSVVLSNNGVIFGTVTVPGYYTFMFTAAVDGKVAITAAVTSGSLVINNLRLITSTASKKWTQTPALMLADLIESPVYGLGLQVDTQSLLNLTRYNEQIIPLSNPPTKRVQIGLSLTQQDSLQNWIETFRAYARCLVNARDSKVYLIPDSPWTTSMEAIVSGDMVSGSFKIAKASLINQPNVIRVYYTNIANVPWTEQYVDAILPEVTSGAQFQRTSELRMPGFQDKSTAYRYAVERLNNSTLIDLTGSFDALDTLFAVEVGDVVTITHPCGMTTVPCRILAADTVDRGKMSIKFALYDDSVYDDSIIDEHPPSDYNGTSPFEVPQVTGLSVTEEFYTAGTDTMSRLRIVWDDLQYAFLQYYYLQIYENGVLVNTARLTDRVFLQPVVEVGATYSITVYGVSTTYAEGSPSNVSYVVQGNNIPPDFSNGQIVAYEGGNALIAYVRIPAIDIDLWGYEWRYRQLFDQNLFPPGGPTIQSSDWTNYVDVGASIVNFDYRSIVWYADFGAANTGYTAPITGLLAGKSYDVYVSFKGIYGGINTIMHVWMPGGAANKTGYSIDLSSVDPISVYKLTYTPTSSDLTGTPAVTIWFEKSGGAAGHCFIEYIAVRETDASLTGDWATAQFITRDPSGKMKIDSVPAGAYIVYCKALDSVRSPANPYGQYSDVTQSANVNIISDATSYQKLSYQLTFGSHTNMPLYPLETQNKGTFLDDGGAYESSGLYIPENGSTWNAAVTGAVNTTTGPMWSNFRPSTGTPVWNSSTYDLKTSITGTASINFKTQSVGDDLSNLSFFLSYKVLSTDSWTRVPAVLGQPTNFSGRFLQVEVDCATGFQAGLVADSQSTLDIQAIPRIETGTITTNGPDGSGNPQPLTVTLQNTYSSVLSIKGYTNTSEPVNVYVQNATTGSPTTFEIFATNLRGYPVAVNANWEFRGV